MPHLTDGNQGWQRVAHDRQSKPLKPGVGQRRQLEGELRDRAPGVVVAEFARQGQHGQDGDGKRPSDDGSQLSKATGPGRKAIYP